MALKETVQELKKLLADMSYDLEKAVKGNKAAAQRVRTHSVLFTKVSKVFRKESLIAEKTELKKRLKTLPKKKRMRSHAKK